jgi:hypothetical protein
MCVDASVTGTSARLGQRYWCVCSGILNRCVQYGASHCELERRRGFESDSGAWLKPVLVAQIEFLEWTGENHLRHIKFVALRDDKPARKVRRE